MTRSHGRRRKGRSTMTKKSIIKGLSYLLVTHNTGDKVIVDIDPREHKTMPHRRFQGKVGVIKEVGRRTLKVQIMIGGKMKILQTRLNHIKPLMEEKVERK